ncbi:hypothetical protein TNCV_4575071 [Trichonephila clavipes]|nr:hypothetical protein TNCV_4575071 [Trichonephila clavipes]
MNLQEPKGLVDGYEWSCRSQSKDNPHDIVRIVRKGTWFSESKLAITIILRLTRYWFGKSMNAFVVNDDLTVTRTASMDREIRVSCNECCRNFPSNNLLEIHHSKHHYIRQCPNCNKTFQHTKKYLKHLRSHLNCLPYHCKICLQPFNKKGDLYNHKIGHDNLEKKIC